MRTKSLSRRIAGVGLVSVSPLALAAGLIAGAASPAAAASCTLTSAVSWALGGSGNWNASGHWSPSGVPNSSSTNVCIVDSASSVVTLDITASVASLQIGSGNGLSMNGGTTLNIAGPSWSNAGSFVINGGGGSNTFVELGGNAALSGGGTVQMNVNPSSGGSAFLRGSNVTLTNVDNTIEGAGNIGDSGALTLNNQATIDANSSGQSLALNAGNGGVTNTGTLEATSGGTLVLNNTIANAGGAITANAGTVQVAGTILGGTLNTSGGGVMEGVGGSSDLNAVTISTGSTFNAAYNQSSHIDGAIVNQGTFAISGGGGANTYVNLGSAVTLTGGGTVQMSVNPSSGGSAYLRGSGQTLTNTDNTIQGAGLIGDSGALTLNNEATIDANSAGQSLALNAGGGGVTNTGTLEATSGGVLVLNNTIDNTNGNITASGSGSTVQVSGTIKNGTLNTSGGGVMEGVGGSSDLNAVTISTGSTFNAAYNQSSQIDGAIVNQGTFAISGGGGANTYVNLGSAVTLTGGGTVQMRVNPSSGGSAYLRGSGQTLTNTDNTIQGAGLIGDSGALTLNNEATIDANSAGQSLALNAGNGGVINTGTLEATGGGVLVLNNTIIDTGANISAIGTGGGFNSTVQVAGTIKNGTLNTSGGGVMEGVGGSSDLNAVTISTGSTFNAAYNQSSHIDGAIVNQGTFAISGGGGANTYVNLGSAVTLTGGGTVQMSVNPSSGGSAYLRGSGQTLTNTDNTIQGAGLIGDSGALTLNNEATIDANSAGQSLALNAGGGGVTNTGTLEATSGGVLVLNNTIDNTNGNITASGSGSTVQVSGTIKNGTLNTSGGGVMEGVGGSSDLNAVTISTGSTFNAAYNQSSQIDGAIVNQGTFAISGGGGANTYVNLGSAVTLTGGGTVQMRVNPSSGGSAYLRGSGQTLTNTDNTIQGAGLIGDSGALTIVNDTLGTILANAGATLRVGGGGGSLTNNGTLQVTPGSILLVTAPLTNYASNTLTGGTYKVSGTSGAAGTLQVNALGSSGGEIHTNAATIVLNGPNSDFVDASGNNALSDLTSNTVSFTIENGRNFTSGAGAFTNTGTVLIGANSAFSTASGDYQQSGASAVTQVDGVLAPSTATVRISGGTLAGTGTVQGSVISIGDTIHPGDVLASDPPGLLTVTGNLSLDSASTFAEDIMGSTPGAGFGVLDVGGAVTLGGTLDVSLSGFNPFNGEQFTILDATGGLNGTQFSISEGLTYANGFFTVGYQSNAVVLDWTSSAVPEPSTWAMMGLGFAGLGFFGYRSRRAVAAA